MTSRPNQIRNRITDFLKSYREPETQQKFENLASLTRKECEQALEEVHVKGVVQSRIKRYHSLEKKLTDMGKDRQFEAWLAKTENTITKHKEMGDLAGVRIGLYLPGDVVTVSEALEKRFDVKHLFGTVTGGREVATERNLQVSAHTNGPWQSEDLKGKTEHWQHYGYKSWQMVVEWKPGRGLPNELRGLRVEIQVGTVVSQAWGEVQHDIIYKRPADILATPSMKRMIDGINGLAITTEIMLLELERSLEVAKKEAENARKVQAKQALQPFKNGGEFMNWFRATYLATMQPGDRSHWEQSSAYADTLVNSSRGVPTFATIMKGVRPESVQRIEPTRNEFAKLIEQKNILHKKKTGRRLDIGRVLLEALGYNLEHLENRPPGTRVINVGTT